MLWYKAWLETRPRFLASLASTVAIVTFFVRHAETIVPHEPRTNTYELFFFAHTYLSGLWILSAMLLGMGGLLREKATGVSSFTLALPVSRAHLVWVRIAVGVLESVALAIVPWAAILAVSALAGRPFLISQAAFYLLLLITGGLVYFATAILVSTLFEGEYTAPAVAYGVAVLFGIVSGSVNKLRPFLDLWRFLTGNLYYNKSTHLLAGPLPWLGIVTTLSVTTVLLAISAKVTQTQEF